ncbi:VOC family protein [Scopulibacillus cellulosilyticus]|uniref:VOC family protein n=1 Tax=Scopulibacillus cellulosilyticus TaxID=2665665 RepID=A0ABW2PWP6_9BACL
MQLFHYHWWTNKVEEMEKFYVNLGFQVMLRVGKYEGEMQTFNSPLKWDDFRHKEITFRIIEMRKGQTNVTFGYGKKDRFDHIGFLVNNNEYKQIINRAEELNWKVNEGERRTFIATPWKIRIELQKRADVITEVKDTMIKTMEIYLPFNDNPKLISYLLGLKVTLESNTEIKMQGKSWSMAFLNESHTKMSKITFLSKEFFDKVDPVNTRLLSVNN